MAERLRVLAEAADPRENPYRNAERVRSLRQRSLPSGARAAVLHEVNLCRELIRAGDSREAAERLAKLVGTGAEPLRPLLALALLRQGEQENCIDRHGSDSCLLPIRGDGVYRIREPTRKAIAQLVRLLEAQPDDLTYRWLLNVAHMTLGTHPEGIPERWRIPTAAFASEQSFPRFPDRAAAVGVDVVGLAGGVAAEDFDGDGRIDLMASSAGLSDPLRFLRNLGDGRFADRSAEAGLEGIHGGLNLIHGDYDNDGDADVYVMRGAWLGIPPATDGGRYPNSLLRNDGAGHFTDVTESAGLLFHLPSQTAAWADFDGDGLLDLFVGNESFGDRHNPCQLFRNLGDGTFSEVAAKVGLEVVGVVKGVTWGDYDDDERPDLYVSRLGAPNLLFRNGRPDAEGGLRFREVAREAGVTEPIASFPTWFWDFDGDGRLDLFVSGYRTGQGSQAADVAAEYLGLPTDAERPRLFRNRGDGTFEDVTASRGLDRVAFTMGSNHGDLDADGFPDLYLGTGDPDLRAIVPNRLFRNDGGLAFRDVTTEAGMGHLQKGHGVAFADLDDDGDLDVYTVLGGFFSGDVYANALFENPGHGNRTLTLELEGTASNRSAIGARIEVDVVAGGAQRTVRTHVTAGGSFGGSSLRRVIGLGPATAIRSVRVRWPRPGAEATYTGFEPGEAYRIVEGSDSPTRVRRAAFRLATGGAKSDSTHRHPHPTGSSPGH